MTTINLIPPDTLLRRDMNRRIRWWARRLGIGLLFLGLLYAGLLHLASGREAEVEQMTSKYALLRERFRRAESLVGERDRLAKRRAAIRSLRDDRTTGWYLEVLGEKLTAGSYLDLIILDRRVSAGSNQARRGKTDQYAMHLKIRGWAPGHGQVGEIIRRLVDSETFGDVNLISVREPRGLRGRGEVEFELQCRLSEEGARDR